jgi:hypothetical protein
MTSPPVSPTREAAEDKKRKGTVQTVRNAPGHEDHRNNVQEPVEVVDASVDVDTSGAISGAATSTGASVSVLEAAALLAEDIRG